MHIPVSLADSVSVLMRNIDMQVGPTYGRKTMTGLLASQGLHVSQRRVGESLCRTNPGYQHARRTATAKRMNPIPYHAEYFGHKLHIDQNEKLVMFGVTHICAVDGYSGKIVGFVTMPVKNNVEIYDHLFQFVLNFTTFAIFISFTCFCTIFIVPFFFNMDCGTRSVLIRGRSGS